MKIYLYHIISYGIAFVGGSSIFWLLYRIICSRLKIPAIKSGIGIRILGGAAALICLNRYGFDKWETGLTVYAFLALLTATAYLDGTTMEISNFCVLLVLALAAAAVFTMPEVPVPARLLGMVSVSGPMLFAALLTSGGFGGGDIKLMAAAGLFLGWKSAIVSAVLAALLGGGYAVLLLIQGKASRRTCFAFGPFLCAGMALGLLFGNEFLEWYMRGF